MCYIAVSVCPDPRYTCAVTEQSPQILAASRSPGGALYSWGRNPDGVLGLNHDRDCLVPTPVDALTGWEVVLVACGVSHSAAVTGGGLLFVWGSGEHGRLGLGDEREDEQQRQA